MAMSVAEGAIRPICPARQQLLDIRLHRVPVDIARVIREIA